AARGHAGADPLQYLRALPGRQAARRLERVDRSCDRRLDLWRARAVHDRDERAVVRAADLDGVAGLDAFAVQHDAVFAQNRFDDCHQVASSISCASVSRNSAPRAPSTTRWSKERLRTSVGRTAGCPSTATTRSLTMPRARIADCGSVPIASNTTPTYILRVGLVILHTLTSTGH